MTTGNLERLDEFYRAVESGSADDVARRLSTDFVIDQPASIPFGGELRGPQAFSDAVAAVERYVQREVTSLVKNETGDGTVVNQIDVKFTSKETGKTLVTNLVELLTFTDDGLLSKIDIYYKDTAAINKLIGDTSR